MTKLLPLTFWLALTACTKMYNVTFDDKHLEIKSGGQMTYRGNPLNGEITQDFPGTEARRVTTYRDGYEDGPTRTWAENGTLIEERYYKKGIKVGIHRGWFDTGADKFYAEFDEQGRYKNESWTWHINGQVYEYKKYDAEGNVIVHKQLRPNGQIYQNILVSKDGQVGVPGSKNCDPVKKKAGNT